MLSHWPSSPQGPVVSSAVARLVRSSESAGAGSGGWGIPSAQGGRVQARPGVESQPRRPPSYPASSTVPPACLTLASPQSPAVCSTLLLHKPLRSAGGLQITQVLLTGTAGHCCCPWGEPKQPLSLNFLCLVFITTCGREPAEVLNP